MVHCRSTQASGGFLTCHHLPLHGPLRMNLIAKVAVVLFRGSGWCPVWRERTFLSPNEFWMAPFQHLRVGPRVLQTKGFGLTSGQAKQIVWTTHAPADPVTQINVLAYYSK